MAASPGVPTLLSGNARDQQEGTSAENPLLITPLSGNAAARPRFATGCTWPYPKPPSDPRATTSKRAREKPAWAGQEAGCGRLLKSSARAGTGAYSNKGTDKKRSGGLATATTHAEHWSTHRPVLRSTAHKTQPCTHQQQRTVPTPTQARVLPTRCTRRLAGSGQAYRSYRLKLASFILFPSDKTFRLKQNLRFINTVTN